MNAQFGNFGSPFPNTTYPGFESENPYTIEGSKSFQFSPPKYPSPWGEGSGDWKEAYAKARALVSQLTLEEKVNLTSGVGTSECFHHSIFCPMLTSIKTRATVLVRLDRSLARVLRVSVSRIHLLAFVSPMATLFSPLV